MSTERNPRLAKQIKLAIVGATGSVGREVLKALDESELLLVDPVLLASEAATGDELFCQGVDVDTQVLNEESFKGVQVALFCTPKDIAAKYIPHAQKAGAVVIDATGHLKDKGAPVIAEGFSDKALGTAQKTGVALPHPLAWSLARLLKALDEKATVKSVTASTYQTVNTAGIKALEEVVQQSIGLLGGGSNGEGFSGDIFPHQAAFNVLPHVGDFTENGQTTAEVAIANDTATLMGRQVPVSVTCVYVPVFVGEAMDLTLTFDSGQAPTPDDVRGMFSPASGIMVLDKPEEAEYATPYGSAETSYIFISRIRKDASKPDALKVWLVADHLRVAVARQMVKLAEKTAHLLIDQKQ